MPPAFTLSQDQTLKFISTITTAARKPAATIPQEAYLKPISLARFNPAIHNNQPKPTTSTKPPGQNPAAERQPRIPPQNTTRHKPSSIPERDQKPRSIAKDARSNTSKSNQYFQKTRCDFKRSTTEAPLPFQQLSEDLKNCQPLFCFYLA
jgi:hypothetical protein